MLALVFLEQAGLPPGLTLRWIKGVTQGRPVGSWELDCPSGPLGRASCSAGPAWEPVPGQARACGSQSLLPAAVRVSCTGCCGVSSKAHDAAWVVEEGYFHSSLSLADKGKSGSQAGAARAARLPSNPPGLFLGSLAHPLNGSLRALWHCLSQGLRGAHLSWRQTWP